MFIVVHYKDVPELSSKRAEAEEEDTSIQKSVLVNPDCPVRIMLEYLRKKCKLGTFTIFDLCDEYGGLKGLFDMPTYEYATKKFQHKKNYYIVVLKMESENVKSVFLQLNRNTAFYEELKRKILRFIESGVSSAPSSQGRTSIARSPAKTPKEAKTPKNSKGKK